MGEDNEFSLGCVDLEMIWRHSSWAVQVGSCIVESGAQINLEIEI